MYVHIEYTRQTVFFFKCQLRLQSDNCEMMSFLLVAISRSGLCSSFEVQHPCPPTTYPHMGVYIFFTINITTSEVLQPNNRFFYSLGAPNLVHLTGRKIVFGIEKYFDGIRTISRYQSQKSGYGYDISIYRILWYRVIRYMISRHIAIYHADHLETPGKYKFNENPPPRCGLLLFFSALSLPSSWLCSSGLFCRSSAVHQLDTS